MKSRRKNDFALGLTALVFAAMLVGTIMFLVPGMRGDTNHIVVKFRHDDGMTPLKVGSPVMLSGALQIGTVTDVRAEERDLPAPASASHLMIIVEADVVSSIKLYRGCQITTDQPPVGGSGILVVLNVGDPNRPLESDEIEGLPPQSLAAAIGTISRRLLAPNGFVDRLDHMLNPDADGSLMNKVLLSLSDINVMTRGLAMQLDADKQRTLMAKVHAIMDDLNATTTALREQTSVANADTLLAKVHVVLDGLSAGLTEAVGLLSENRPIVRRTLTHVERATRTLDDEMLAALRAELDRDNPASMLGKLHVAMDHVNASLTDVEAIAATGRRTILVNRPLIDRVLANFKETSEQLKHASQEIRLAPWRLLYRPGARESDEMSIFEAARTFAEAATYLDDAASRLEAALAASPPGEPSPAADEEVRAIRESLRAAFERFERAEQFLWEKMK